MEVYLVTPDIERDCNLLPEGKISTEQSLPEIKRKSGDREQVRRHAI